MVYILLEYGHKYFEDKKLAPYPNDWKDEAEVCMSDNNQVKDWFENTFTLHPDAMIHKDFVESIFNQRFKDKHCRDALKALKKPIKYDSQSKSIKNKMRDLFVYDMQSDPI